MLRLSNAESKWTNEERERKNQFRDRNMEHSIALIRTNEIFESKHF